MVVMWNTMNDTATSTVRFGSSPSKLTLVAHGSSSSYLQSFQHTVELNGLQTGREQYFYQCGDAQGGWSATFSFITKAKAARDASFAIGMVGDTGVKYSQNTSTQMQKRLGEFDFVWHVGDFAYSDDRKTQDYESTYNQFQREIEPIAAQRAYMTVPGNHDASCHSYGSWLCPPELDNFTAYRHRFNVPYEASGSATPMWYSFDFGNAHFVAIDTETSYKGSPEGVGTMWNAGPFGDQLKWLKNDLARANDPAQRAKVPWLFVLGHRPLYTTESIDWPLNAVQTLRDVLEELFAEFGVDVYFCGHVHAVERMWPVSKNGTVVEKSYDNPQSPVYIVNGAAGNIETHTDHWMAQTPEYLAKRNGADYGFAKLLVHNSTTLTWQFVRADDGEVDDEFTLTKTRSRS
eukprot:TRINITY_DN86809_c0_g1_i1.p1 TRINITY_DN86809_c0_g1~~TRINITY_DN86809_c0_g1_i1.p1  ORF type:complete len:446 (+),score=238.13 TRINITY_DN86809_c0_g1_i1:128-1339(+)